MNQTKRIVIIEGDAFDADAIVAIYKSDDNKNTFGIYVGVGESSCFAYTCDDEVARDKAFDVAVDAWRKAVGDLPVPHPEPLPFPPVIDEPEGPPNYWSDEKGRYYETYGGKIIYNDLTLGNFIWNEGPPRRKNQLGLEASPIVRVYVDREGKPLDPQP